MHCCACAQMCCHTGAHSYCWQHTGRPVSAPVFVPVCVPVPVPCWHYQPPNPWTTYTCSSTVRTSPMTVSVTNWNTGTATINFNS